MKVMKLLLTGARLGAAYAVLRAVATATDEKLDGPEAREWEPEVPEGLYVGKIKPALDSVLSFAGMAVLLPVYAATGALIFMDDPGPVFFAQKRVGKGKRHFSMHKFRTMKRSAPHDMPTHLLEDPEKYITRVGKICRQTSIDELPQLWDVFRGKLSLVGPRPALWNQDDLIAERERYGANDVMPGITGWAQINGRDELPIELKARFDGEYATAMRAGGWKAFCFDCKCLFGTVGKVLRHEGVLEGGKQ